MNDHRTASTGGSTMRRTGFTLIELLVSMAIGSMIVAATWSAFNQIRLTTVRSKALTTLNANAAVVHTALEQFFSSTFHGGQFRIGISDAGDPAKAAITVDVMHASMMQRPNLGRIVPSDHYRNDLIWGRIRFLASNADGRPALYRATTPSTWQLTPRSAYAKINDIQRVPDPADASRQVPVWIDEDIVVGSTTNASTAVLLGPDARRDRRRSMLDNDTRLMPNIPASVYNLLTLDAAGNRVRSSDGEWLDARLSLIVEDISHVRFEVVDYLGNRTTNDIDAATGAPIGFTYRDKHGAAITPLPPDPLVPGAPDVWSSTLRVVDGIWSDGRPDPCPYNPAAGTLPNPALERPALIRVSFRMSDRLSKISRDFAFSFPLSPITVQGP